MNIPAIVTICVQAIRVTMNNPKVMNALKIKGQKIEDAKIVINGAGAAGISIAKFLPVHQLRKYQEA